MLRSGSEFYEDEQRKAVKNVTWLFKWWMYFDMIGCIRDGVSLGLHKLSLVFQIFLIDLFSMQIRRFLKKM